MLKSSPTKQLNPLHTDMSSAVVDSTYINIQSLLAAQWIQMRGVCLREKTSYIETAPIWNIKIITVILKSYYSRGYVYFCISLAARLAIQPTICRALQVILLNSWSMESKHLVLDLIPIRIKTSHPNTQMLQNVVRVVFAWHNPKSRSLTSSFSTTQTVRRWARLWF